MYGGILTDLEGFSQACRWQARKEFHACWEVEGLDGVLIEVLEYSVEALKAWKGKCEVRSVS